MKFLPMDKKKIVVRALSGAVYVAIVVSLIFLGSVGVFPLAILFSILATIEFDRISFGGRKSAAAIACDAVANGLMASFAGAVFVPIVLGVRFLIQLYSKSNRDKAVSSLSSSLMSVVYIGLPMMSLSLLSYIFGVYNGFVEWIAAGFASLPKLSCATLVLAMFILIWLNDTGAYLVGCMCGRHKLFERVSPKKTWEGFFGGMAFCLIGAAVFYCFNDFFFPGDDVPLAVWLVYGVLVAVFATWGDLIESMIKRNAGVKDSGNVMPGHGGILDRIDSLLAVAPMTLIYWYLIVTAVMSLNL